MERIIRKVMTGLILVLLVMASLFASSFLKPLQAASEPKKTESPIEPQPVKPTTTPASPETVSVPTAIPAGIATAESEIAYILQPVGQAKPESAILPSPVPLDPEQWQEWPVLPVVSPRLREIYRRGLAQGNRSGAFSVLGDCQSQPEIFLGVYDSDPVFVRTLPGKLQETVRQFSGSFDRYSPAVKDGTTEGALLWAQWNDNKEKKCRPGESPLDCELRVHRPSIVFVHVGTHWEARNRHYLTIILDKVLATGAIPILVTKADNRELDQRVNQNLASLAAEYDLPLWNFWASVQHLPEHGMEKGSDMYLSKAGLEIHRAGALEVLDAVWRSLK
jgi:hypothetical protein